MLDDEAEILVNLRAPKVMYVLEHEDERIGDGRPRGQQPADKLRRQPVHVRRRRRSPGEGTRDRALQGQDEREPEALRPVVAGVECHPFPGDRAQGLEPLRDGHGLPCAGAAGHQRHPPVGLGENLGQARTGNRPDWYCRAPELRARNREWAVSGGAPHVRTNHRHDRIRPGSEAPKAESPIWRLARAPDAGHSRRGEARQAHPERVWATHPVRRFPEG